MRTYESFLYDIDLASSSKVEAVKAAIPEHYFNELVQKGFISKRDLSSDIIILNIAWVETEEGFDFWNDLFERLNEIESER